MNTLLSKFTQAARSVLGDRGFAWPSVLGIALGVGLCTAMFSFVNAVLIRPLPFPGSERLVMVGQQFGNDVGYAGQGKYLFWRRNLQAFESTAMCQEIYSGGMNLSGEGRPERASAMKASASFFPVLGVNPFIGRSFIEEEDQPGGPAVAMLSHGLWMRRFGGDPGVLNKSLILDGRDHRIVGVLPKSFRFLITADVVVPMRASEQGDPNPNQMVIGRLKPGVAPGHAKADLQRVGELVRAEKPESMDKNESVGMKPLQEVFAQGSGKLLWILLGATALLLLIACVNVASLQLTRAINRVRDTAVRVAVGAGMRDLLHQLALEALVVAALGGLAGLVVAWAGVQLLQVMVPDQFLTMVWDLRLDGRVVAFALAAALFSVLLSGVAPALQATRVNLVDALKTGGKNPGAAGRGILRRALVVSEIALASVLLSGALLLFRTFLNVQKVHPGFDATQTIAFMVTPTGPTYAEGESYPAFAQQVVERLKAIPGVKAAASTTTLPLRAQFNFPFHASGEERLQSAQFRVVSPDYFQAFGVRLLQGRTFLPSDHSSAAPVAVVSAAFAKKVLERNGDPLGQPLHVGGKGPEAPPTFTVVGVVEDIKQYGLDRPAPRTYYIPMAQVPPQFVGSLRRFTGLHFILKTESSPATLRPLVEEAIQNLDRSMPVEEFRTMEEVLSNSMAPQRFNLQLFALFSSLGLLLAGLGVFGVMSYSVLKRSSEFGVRFALGATRAAVLRLVLFDGAKLAFLGATLGLAASLALGRVASAFLFGLGAADPLTHATVFALLMGCTLLAALTPALHASRIEPSEALRNG